MLGLASVGVFQLAGQVSTAEFLQVDTVAVQGNTRLSGGEVLAMLGRLRGQNLLTVDLAAYRDILRSSGWVDTVTLRRVLPSTLEVRVVERVPAAVARFGSRLYLIDVNGDLIDQLGPGFAGADLPIVDGLSLGTERTQHDAAAAGGVDPDDDRRKGLASRVLHALATVPEMSALVSQIGVHDPYDAVVLLSDEPTVVHLGHDEFAERLRRYMDIAPTLRERVSQVDYVDMRFEHRVVIRVMESARRPGTLATLSESRTLRYQ